MLGYLLFRPLRSEKYLPIGNYKIHNEVQMRESDLISDLTSRAHQDVCCDPVFNWQDRQGCEFASRASMPNRSRDAIGGLKVGLPYPRFRPDLVRLGHPQPIVDHTCRESVSGSGRNPLCVGNRLTLDVEPRLRAT